MGSSLSIIIRHDFYELDDNEKSCQFVKNTIERINNKLGTEALCDERMPIGLYDEKYRWANLAFEIPSYDVLVDLRRGYWSITPGCHYCQVACKVNGRMHISDLSYNLARLFDQNEAWYCDEYIDDQCMMMTLDELIAEATRQHGIAEYPYAEFMKHTGASIPECRSFYHDAFEQRNK